ncbi:MAG TPA: glutaredoxin domain-containing protein [Acidisarcina sp.]
MAISRRVILYSQPACPPCYAAKNYLTARRIDFEYKNVQGDPEAMRELLALNSRSTPTIVVGEGVDAQVMIGFDPEKLDAMLALASTAS